MNTLSIPEIFANFSFYQTHYLSILADPEQYHLPVASAYINVWPIGHINLCLGDLLQLWFSEKWLINQTCLALAEHPDDGRKTPLQRDNDLYLYQLSGSALSGSNRCQVWSVSAQKSHRVYLDGALKYYTIYKSIGTVQAQNQLATQFKTAF